MPRAGLTDKDIHECRQSKQDAEDNGSLEERLLKPPARVETGAEVVSTERTPEARSGALQQDRSDEEDREGDLHVWQYRRDFHGFKVSKRGGEVNRMAGYDSSGYGFFLLEKYLKILARRLRGPFRVIPCHAVDGERVVKKCRPVPEGPGRLQSVDGAYLCNSSVYSAKTPESKCCVGSNWIGYAQRIQRDGSSTSTK